MVPEIVVAPIGAEVVLMAGVPGADGGLAPGRRIEWTLDPAGVGHFVTVDGIMQFRPFIRFSSAPEKIDATFAVGKTARQNITLTRGTPTETDDLIVLRGQTWISVTSPAEGTSYVSAFSPEVHGWDGRLRTSRVHWVDAQWSFPPPAVNPAGSSHTLTTTVLRQSDRTPIEGWRVRYEILDGPAAGFAPGGATVTEVPTNELGQASVEVVQQQIAGGTNTIRVEIIRPGNAPGASGRRMSIATGTTTKTWSSPDIALRKTGPAQGSIGSTLTYRIEVTNPGAVAATGVTVADAIPAGLAYLDSNPPAANQGGQLRWELGTLAAGETRGLEVRFRADQAGTVDNCATATTAEGLTAQDCATTTILVPSLEASITGPSEVAVGQQTVFDVLVTNRGSVPASGLVLVARFDAGLRHDVSGSPIERPINDLQPGESQRVQVVFTAAAAGQQCVTIEVAESSGVATSSRACVEVTSGAPPPPSTTPGDTQPPSTQPQPPGNASLRVIKRGPAQREVGNTALFSIEVTNTGQVPLSGIKVVDNYDLSLDPRQATEGYEIVGQDLVWREQSLAAGESVRFEINCRCTQAVEQACNRVTVTADQGVRADDEFCLRILPPPEGLSISITDLNDPIAVGRQLTYEVRVANQGQQAERNVIVEVQLPNLLAPVQIGTSGPTGYEVIGQIVRFAPVAEMPPGKVETYRVRVDARAVGTARILAEVRSERITEPLTAEETTTLQVEPP